MVSEMKYLRNVLDMYGLVVEKHNPGDKVRYYIFSKNSNYQSLPLTYEMLKGFVIGLEFAKSGR